MHKTAVFLTMLLVSFGILGGEARADKRSYVWTYEYMTMPKGMWEVEYYATSEVPNINRSNINTLKQWVELEYGITSRWDVAMYQMWKFKNKRAENDSSYDGFKLRTRYRFADKGKLPVDVLLYLEYIRESDWHKPNVGEAKLILAKDIGQFNISYNQVVKGPLEAQGLAEWEYACGISHPLPWNFKLGIESKGNFTKDKFAVGPVISFAAPRFWVTLGTAFGANKRTDDLQTRLIVGVPF